MAEADPVEVVDDPTKTDEVVDDAAAGSEVEQPAEVKPGTPDKALQRLQQELGNAVREIAALKEKKSDEGLTAADKAKLEKAQRRLEMIREQVGDPIAEHVLELNERMGEQDRLKSELAETQRRLAMLEEDQGWKEARSRFPGLDHNAIWKKAVADAEETLGDAATPKAVSRVASRTFEQRCKAALKRMKEKDAESKSNNKASSASTYKVGSGQKTAPVLSEEEQVLAEALALVVEI